MQVQVWCPALECFASSCALPRMRQAVRPRGTSMQYCSIAFQTLLSRLQLRLQHREATFKFVQNEFQEAQRGLALDTSKVSAKALHLRQWDKDTPVLIANKKNSFKRQAKPPTAVNCLDETSCFLETVNCNFLARRLVPVFEHNSKDKVFRTHYERRSN